MKKARVENMIQKCVYLVHNMYNEINRGALHWCTNIWEESYV